MEPDPQQFIDLIAENAQIKEEIRSIRRYNGTIQLFGRKIVKAVHNDALNGIDESESFGQLIASVKAGLSSVESAQSFAKRMVNERIMKKNQSALAEIEEFNKKMEENQAKLAQLTTDIDASKLRIASHTKSLDDAEKIKVDLNGQITQIGFSADKMNEDIKSLNQQIESEQSQSIKLRKAMEQALKSLNSYIQSRTIQSSSVSSAKAMAEDLRSYLEASKKDLCEDGTQKASRLSSM